VIWGEPRRAEEIDLKTGHRGPWKIAKAAYEYGCPQISPDGHSLLFEKKVDGIQEIFLSETRDVTGGKQLIRGAAPTWLPNGQEFVFVLDTRHAAMFSVSTRQMVVVGDVGNEYAIDDLAVDALGKSLAILYSSTSLGSVLIVYGLPDLRVLSQSQVPRWARNLTFDDVGNIRFTIVTREGSRQLVSTKSDTKDLTRIAFVPSSDIRETLTVGHTQLAIARTVHFDLQSIDETGAITALTSDGRSVHGSFSSSRGLVLIQRRLPDSREAIVLRHRDGSERQVTSGPTDVAPAFFPDGDSWVFAKASAGELQECSVTEGTCSVLVKDPLVPIYATPSPSGGAVAYVTALNGTRVRVVSRSTKVVRDLGSAQLCPPLWNEENRMWIVIASGPDKITWAEIDSLNGKRTGQVRSAKIAAGRDDCPVPSDLAGLEKRPRVVSSTVETAELSAI
jgi:hypothetical protein